ncbi:ATP-binding SpoIIE family protein phosphatase [Paraburkholderia phytofirmans]|uniref:Putative anti-sigma regulatory factor, serine/threonine protein kinase n=1 Tax=Paraburkholderia phytofirmans (strain DSM 17436 / LMG 22146 / PsJN) TaxID=398527 RepID=B2TGE3_PARPJ|nr:ATP-binding SpoIIE family protein phosphatase [Paraburkholderia phytofirmans]ACD20115.1 putative anti-sigma regulatory factor, serine/threonine protein kinase [Paraburkholderia phytofirmans PsJN]
MEATLSLTDKSGVADIRRRAIHMAHVLGLSDKRQADVALILTEAATNILKYAGHGEITLRSYEEGNTQALEIIALDRGPGIANVATAMTDGFSTGGSLGAGLGTIERHSTLFDIYSVAGAGTALLARIANAAENRPDRYQIGFKSTPKAGQEVCGDAWGVRRVGGSLWMTLLDGLGHGPMAFEASNRAVSVFLEADPGDLPADVLRRAHQGIKATRGAVMAVAMFDAGRREMSFAGVGNIVGIVAREDRAQHLLSTDGTVGYNMRTVRPSEGPWTAGNVFIATTDGLSTRWSLSRHPGLISRHPSLIASVLHRDFARDADDATIIVLKAI